jgi:hypothetical protein
MLENQIFKYSDDNLFHTDGWYSLSDSQDIDHICNYYGLDDVRSDITGIMVLVGDGDYDDVWFTESSRPYSIEAKYYPLSYYKEGISP